MFHWLKSSNGEDTSPSFLRQVLACSAVYPMCIAIGASAGFSGISLPSIEKELGLNHISNSAWFASFPTLIMIPTCIMGGILGDMFGRRNVILTIAPFFALSFVLEAVSNNFNLLYIGRILCGTTSGLVCGPAAAYVSEVASSRYRTSFGSGLGLFYTVGMLITYIMGSLVNWRFVAGTSTLFPCISFIMFYFINESPVWLLTKGRKDEAIAALRNIRGPKYRFENEIESINNSIKRDSTSVETIESTWVHKKIISIKKFLCLFRREDVFKPLFLITAAMFFLQFTGMATLTYFAVSILSKSNSYINEYIATILYGIMRLVGQILSFYLLVKFDRRVLYVFSAIATFIGLNLLALSFYLNFPNSKGDNFEENLNANTEQSSLKIIPFISVSTIALAYQIGISPITWSYTAELFPSDVRSQLSGIANCIAQIFIFTVASSFPYLSDDSHLTMAGTYWLYSGICFGAIFFGFFCLPETKNRNFGEISHFFRQSNKPENTPA